MMPSEYPGIFFGSRSSGIKKSKPAMEKRRRARINASLAELRSLIPESVKRGNRRCSKMEKADILELAVSYLRHLQDASKDKGQVSKTSYNLGFSECTQEVSQFFRSTSPSTSTIKGTLLEHLNGCAPDHHPDSPSSSAVNSAPTSTNRFFKTSSIIARCLLSSTMVVTPEKISGYTRHSNTPAAVSSTSDADSSEVTVDAQDLDDPVRLDTGTEMLKPVKNETLGVQRLEVFKVKKDLIDSFNNEPIEQDSPSRPGNFTTSKDNLDQSSTIAMLQDNTELRDLDKEKNIQHKNEDDDSKLPIIVNSGEPITNAVSNVCSLLSPTKIIEPLIEATLLNKQEELSLPETLIPIKTSPSNVQMSTQTNENTDVKMSKPAAATNNNSSLHISTVGETETHRIISLSTKAHGNLDFTIPRQHSDNALEGSFISKISPVADNYIHDKNIANQTQAHILPLEISVTEPACSEIEIPQNTSTSECQIESVALGQIRNNDDKTGCPQGSTSKICLTTESSSSMIPKISSFLIPAYVQASLQRELPSLQQTVILKSPTRTNTIVPKHHATIPDLTDEMTTDDSRAANINDVSRSDEHLCSSKVSEAICPPELSPLYFNPNICPEFSTLRLLECQKDSQTDIKESNIIPTLQTTGNEEKILPIIISNFTENVSNIKENKNAEMKNINSLVNVSKTTNFSTLLLNPVNLTNITSFSRKRLLSEADLFNEKKFEGHEQSRSEDLDNPKHIRLTPTNILQSGTYQDSLCTNETLRQYMATKFRPIAPKNMRIRKVECEDDNVFQQKVNASQLSCKQQSQVNNNIFASMSRSNSILGNTNNIKIGKEHISNNNSAFSSNGGNHQLLAQCANVQSFINKESTYTSSKLDDILRTVLKSSIPLDKSLFETRRLNTCKANKNWSSAEPKTVTKHQNEHFNQRSLHDTHANLNSLCQSHNGNTFPTQSSTFTDLESTFQCQNQHCEEEKEGGNVSGARTMSLGDDRNVSFDPTDKHPHYNVSAILRELCQRCQLSDDDSRTKNSEDSTCVYKRSLVAGTSRNLSSVSSQYDKDGDTKTANLNFSPHHERDREMKTGTWNSSPQHDGDSKLRKEVWNSSPKQDQDSDMKTEKLNSSPQYNGDRGIEIGRWNSSPQHSRDSVMKTESLNSSRQHDRKSHTKTRDACNFSPIDLTISQQRYSCTHLAEYILDNEYFPVTESSQNKTSASDKDRTSSKNEKNVISSEFNIHVKNSTSTNNIPDKLASALSQPLNLSLRVLDRVIKTSPFQDKETTDKDNTSGLDLSLRNCIKTPESTFNRFRSSSDSPTSGQSDNENDSPTIKSYKHTSSQSDNRSQKNETYLTNSTNLPTALSSAVFSQIEQSKESKSSLKDTNLYQRTNTECTSYLTSDVDTLSRHTFMSTFSSKAAQQIEFENCSKNLQCTPRTSLDSSLCLPNFNQNCQLLVEKSMKTPLPSLSHAYHNPGDTAGVGDDVWRPW